MWIKVITSIIKAIPLIEKVVTLKKKYIPFWPYRYFIIITISIVVSTSINIHYINKSKENIVDYVKNSKKSLIIRHEFENIRNEACIKLNYDTKKCPLYVRSFMYQYNTKKKSFANSGAWCLGHKDMLSKPDEYFEIREIYMSEECKNLLKTHSGLIKKNYLELLCPFVANNCIFKIYDNNMMNSKIKFEYASLSCTDNKSFQGVSCFAMIGDYTVEDFRLSITHLPIAELLSQRIVDFEPTYFGEKLTR